MAAEDDGAQGKTSALRAAHVISMSVARLGPLVALLPPRDAKGGERVEDRGAERTAVDERAAQVLHDVGLVGEQVGDPAAHVGDRVRGRRGRRSRGHLDHQPIT